MTPQHFQQQALWGSLCDERVARIASAEPWGVCGVEFDKHALSVSRLKLDMLQVRMPDGTWIDSDNADRLPAARSLDDIPSDVAAAVVWLGLPLFDAQGGNCIDDGQETARPRRFVREYLHVADLHEDGKEEIGVERHALTLLFDFEKGSDYIVCPLGRVVRSPQGYFELDPAFVPPSLMLSSSSVLIEHMQRLSEVLAAKSASLSARRKERTDQIADYAVADVSLFWLLHSVNSAWPELARLRQAPNQHPERLYIVLARLAGALLTFSTTESLKSIPPYDHVSPGPVFAQLDSLIRNLLDKVIPSRVVPIALERVRPTLWSGSLNDERLIEEGEYYLAVHAAVPAHELIEHMPRLCKAGAPDEVQQIVNSALPGIPLIAMPRLPAAIPVRVDTHYFAFDSKHPAFERMKCARACQIYVPASIPDVSLELYVVLPA